ncbi:hypothetical protein GCM10009555_014970 [Acrocarpospora macrocephala]|uniref:Uncharacterized protein n=1 Tax=Acrocarpospora macrocephala TaxID=150177 RepID=A0A5M3WH54_9ACTN|nr:hypothetical protein Amac_019000 [Acrocarpospora macrocephala]
MQVGDLQDPDRADAGGEHGHVEASQAKPVALDDSGIPEPGDAEAEQGQGYRDSFPHPPIMPEPVGAAVRHGKIEP